MKKKKSFTTHQVTMIGTATVHGISKTGAPISFQAAYTATEPVTVIAPTPMPQNGNAKN